MVHLTNYITKHQDVHVHGRFPKPAGNNPRKLCFMALPRGENNNTFIRFKVLHVERMVEKKLNFYLSLGISPEFTTHYMIPKKISD